MSSCPSTKEWYLTTVTNHSCKMFIRGKPIRFGYKIWTMSSANGYPYALKIYAGRDERKKSKMIRTTGTMKNSRTRKIPIMRLTRWNDNAVVTLASNHLTHHPTDSVQRYLQSQKKHVKIRMPEIVRRYNTSMDGVDILDKLLSSYRPRLR
ncbi:PiggyBac transposable element-derived protein [Trichinella spiralis]|uniref:PiggyBac transposable element-derived protein n=1 Tax=Trichinella spiralis TaxID=6334 RepID=A0ABR3KV14_TRISP